MKVLVLNCGSSSIKYKLFEMTTKEVLAQGGIEKIGLPGSFLKLTLPNGEKKVIEKDVPEHTTGVQFIFDTLTNAEYGAVSNLHEIKAVGHRVLHGGTKFSGSVLIDDAVIAAVEECCDLGPLHNPANLKGIYAVQKLLPEVPQVAVFDTSFHQTLPKKAFIYGIPYEYYEEYGVRRYGFHGTSHKFVAEKACRILGWDITEKKIITCHLGNGASITAIDKGKSVDTSMGFTPVAGLVMGTRAGDLDLGALLYICEKEGLDLPKANNLINKKSGVQGISGVSSDFRELQAAMEKGNEKAALALDVFCYNVKKYIGAYAAVLNGVDLIIFTGGIGENDNLVRWETCKNMDYLGIQVDKQKNEVRGKDTIISTEQSTTTVMTVTTDEELVIAMDTVRLS